MNVTAILDPSGNLLYNNKVYYPRSGAHPGYYYGIVAGVVVVAFFLVVWLFWKYDASNKSQDVAYGSITNKKPSLKQKMRTFLDAYYGSFGARVFILLVFCLLILCNEPGFRELVIFY